MRFLDQRLVLEFRKGYIKELFELVKVVDFRKNSFLLTSGLHGIWFINICCHIQYTECLTFTDIINTINVQQVNKEL